MISAAEIAISLRGAVRLALRDRAGLAFFDTSVAGFWRSFTAAILALPAYAVLLAARDDPGGPPLDDPGVLLVEAIAYVIGWFAFPNAMYHVTALLDRRERFVPYIVAVNWCNLLQVLLVAAITLLGFIGFPEQFVRFFAFVAFLWTLSYHWFVARAALEVSGLAAAGIVALDILLSLIVMDMAMRIEGG